MSVTAVPIAPVKRRYLVYLVIGLVLAAVAAVALAMQGPVDPSAAFLARNAKQAGVVTTASGLQYQVLEKGQGAPPTDTDVALITYVGKLPDGSVFDQSQQPVPMPVAGVVPGFSEALKLMPKGAKYRVWIKPSLGYGGPRPAGAPPLEGKAAELATQVLAFDVQLLDYLPEAVIRQMQMQQQMGGAMPGGAPGAPAPGAIPGGPPPGR
ncbi:Domain amino terminal to FKBP-type peptidyl-prolyl isomerase [Sphingomonas guangdongensis]|uniref:Peptidyl-prolyl cis-trans isomerase n=1 Tax=Sphingomonas guangdongensis TaxID=1141890 RepID=A0A285QBM5_9SPHN|nr:FKBP-type peptidyl-prolyl cis-trans isomerase [Sphingomonas guangdongensis]SOB79345.1 Domain amino terminal to FKBP-type peptidyl-prolyl isomerase [Sphingomonas guangdongensis]